MKLQRLIIKNFRGLKGENNIIDFSQSDIIFLIGQNNVGKSTYLRAYEFFTNSKQIAVETDFYNYNPAHPIEMEGWFLKEMGDDSATDFVGTGKSADPEWVAKWANQDGIVKVRKKWSVKNGSFIKETFSPIESVWKLNGFGGFDSLFSKYSPQPIAINAMEDEASLQEKVNKLIQDKYIKNLKTVHEIEYNAALNAIADLQRAVTESEDIAALNTDLNKHFQETFHNLVLKIHADKTENLKLEDSFKKNHTVVVEHEGICEARQETFLQNGHGVIRQALFNFLTFLRQDVDGGVRKEYIILFEEPELFLHPKVTFKLRESLYKLAKDSLYQVLCATHSPMMIDISKPHASLIRAVKEMDETTHTYQVGENIFGTDDDVRQRVQMINRFNPHICEAFYADQVILVEGDTEAIVYRDLLSRFFSDREVFVLNTGSKNNFPFFQTILTKFHIKHCAIHDVDTEYLENGNKNSAWSLNQRIWDKIIEANDIEEGLARRYVHNANFENAHKYNLLSGKDKPLQAYKFAKTITSIDDNIDCLNWLRDYFGDQSIIHDMDYIRENAKTIQTINEEKDIYKNL